LGSFRASGTAGVLRQVVPRFRLSSEGGRVGARRVTRRLARFLISCFGKAWVDDGIVRVKLPLAHEAIAQRIGYSRETVSRAFSNFRRRGVAELVDTTLWVHDRTALERLSAG
ncbi:MAG TPA: helix-turn-helix domain-containing protein, partial [Terriglobales bacterium]